jgi:LacI family transcriptional regulator
MTSKHEITIKDIASIANVSHTTVSRALADSPLVVESTKQKIKEIARDLGYVPNQLAKGLVTRSTKTIGLVIPNISNPYYPEVEEGIEAYANSLGYDVLISNTKMSLERERAALVSLYSKRVDGIILSPIINDVDYLFEMFPRKYPLVIVANQTNDNQYACVYTDPVQCGYLATEYLIKIGHRRIAFVGGKETFGHTIGRVRGYRQAMERFGIEFNPEWVNISEEGKEAGYMLMNQLLMKSILPTAVVCYNDVTALGVMQAIEDYGLRIPQNISVVGIDDISFSSIFRIELTSVRQDKNRIGQLSAEILINKILDPDYSCEVNNQIEPRLVIRKSSSGISHLSN